MSRSSPCDRIRSHGVNVLGAIDHGMCQSIYFAGPDQMTLEVATSAQLMDPVRWIDPATMMAAGIDTAEAERYNPPAYVGTSPVPQPPYDPTKPHQQMPAELYRALLTTPDEVVTAMGSYAEPPVRQPA